METGIQAECLLKAVPCLVNAAEIAQDFPEIDVDRKKIWPYHNYMATMTIKSTYALDPATVSAIADLARRQGVSKSEALRRAVRLAAGRDAGAIEALDALQGAVGLSGVAAGEWVARNRSERRAASVRRETSSR
jgi:hypothetical protein